MAETLGFIGLGNMGEPIAGNLLRAGFGLRVYNRTTSKAAALVARGAELASTSADVALPGGIVLTMLADDRALEEVCCREVSFVERLGPGGVHISLSTIAPGTSRRLAKHHKNFGVAYVGSPVFGRPEAAAAAKLWICSSGEAEAKKRARPLQRAIGQEVFDFGEDVGAANVIKLCGNFVVASAIEALGEAITLAEKNGVNKNSFVEMIGKMSPLYYGYAKQIAENKFEPAGFRLVLGLKDINLILQAAAESTTPMPLGSLLHDRWLSALAKGRQDLDWSAAAIGAAEDAGLR